MCDIAHMNLHARVNPTEQENLAKLSEQALFSRFYETRKKLWTIILRKQNKAIVEIDTFIFKYAISEIAKYCIDREIPVELKSNKGDEFALLYIEAKTLENIIIMQHMSFIDFVIKKLHIKSREVQDVKSQGVLALFYAVTRYKYKLGLRFNTYAFYWIRKFALDYIASTNIITDHVNSSSTNSTSTNISIFCNLQMIQLLAARASRDLQEAFKTFQTFDALCHSKQKLTQVQTSACSKYMNTYLKLFRICALLFVCFDVPIKFPSNYGRDGTVYLINDTTTYNDLYKMFGVTYTRLQQIRDDSIVYARSLLAAFL